MEVLTVFLAFCLIGVCVLILIMLAQVILTLMGYGGG